MTGRANIKDVARLAGVSFKTVSRVVNGEGNVSAALSGRVLAAIAELEYIPNTSARSLKSGVGDVVGVIVDNIDDPFFAALISAIEELALESGVGLLIASTGVDADREREALLRLAGHSVRGLILAPVAQDPSEVAIPANLPVVLVDRQRDSFTSVLVDDFGLTFEAVSQFIELGHRRVAFVGLDARFQTSQRRFEGYRRALEVHGIEIDLDLLPEGGANPLSDHEQTQRLLDLSEPPTAIFASHPRAAMEIVEVLHQRERTDIALISFGDFPMAGALSPAVSYVHHDARAIGAEALRLVLASTGRTRHEDVFVPAALVTRGSGELAPTKEYSR